MGRFSFLSIGRIPTDLHHLEPWKIQVGLWKIGGAQPGAWQLRMPFGGWLDLDCTSRFQIRKNKGLLRIAATGDEHLSQLPTVLPKSKMGGLFHKAMK